MDTLENLKPQLVALKISRLAANQDNKFTRKEKALVVLNYQRKKNIWKIKTVNLIFLEEEGCAIYRRNALF